MGKTKSVVLNSNVHLLGNVEREEQDSVLGGLVECTETQIFFCL